MIVDLNKNIENIARIAACLVAGLDLSPRPWLHTPLVAFIAAIDVLTTGCYAKPSLN